MTARLRLGIPPACPFDDVLYVELSAGASIERSDTLRDIGAKITELLDVGEQLTTNSLLNIRRKPFDLGHCSFQRLHHVPLPGRRRAPELLRAPAVLSSIIAAGPYGLKHVVVRRIP
jgi:hypothetical protein